MFDVIEKNARYRVRLHIGRNDPFITSALMKFLKTQ